jgi:hypothetical protein
VNLQRRADEAAIAKNVAQTKCKQFGISDEPYGFYPFCADFFCRFVGAQPRSRLPESFDALIDRRVA